MHRSAEKSHPSGELYYSGATYLSVTIIESNKYVISSHSCLVVLLRAAAAPAVRSHLSPMA